MHFSRLAIVALPILGASASVLPRTGGGCNGGSVEKCCPQVIQSTALPGWLQAFFAGIGVSLDSIAPAVGLNCLVGVSNCQSNDVCCSGNNYQDGLINISTGCTPVIV